jgi:ribosomal protein S18 acetylase RimI-like enzyme
VIIFVVESQGQLFGYMSVLEQFSTWDMDWYIYLDCLYLEEQTRGQGLGWKLMLRLQQYAKDKGLTSIQWQTPNENLSAIGFYEKLGAVGKHKRRFFWSTEKQSNDKQQHKQDKY